MLDITYHPQDESTAQRLKADILKGRLKLERPMLIVLATPDSLAEPSVKQAIAQATAKKHRIAYIALKPVSVAQGGDELPPLDFTNAYSPRQILPYLNRVDMGKGRARIGRALTIGLWVSVAVMFFLAIWGVGSGNVVFPVSEYMTENAINEARIQAFILPTLEGWMPRTTQDAQSFSLTVEAVPTRYLVYTLQTATALPAHVEGTQNAIATNALATSMALTAQPSPTPR